MTASDKTTPAQLTVSEKTLLDDFRALSAEDQAGTLRLVSALADAGKGIAAPGKEEGPNRILH